jgi:hypothetical protein
MKKFINWINGSNDEYYFVEDKNLEAVFRLLAILAAGTGLTYLILKLIT